MREHDALPELMHGDVFGYYDGIHIENAKTTLAGKPGVAVYRTSSCAQLAKQKSSSILAIQNADGYAWFATAKYFSDR